jgi:hypothetical protein
MVISHGYGRVARHTQGVRRGGAGHGFLSHWHFRPQLEALEERCLLSGNFRSITGYGNNSSNPYWGEAGNDLLRVAPAAYADGISKPAGANRPSARIVSNQIDRELQSQPNINNRYLSDFVYLWGQFIDHDLSLTEDAILPNGKPAAPLNIKVPRGDPVFDPQGTDQQFITFNRSTWDSSSGTGQNNPLQQPNEVTAFLDGSQIYGSDPTRAAALRTFQGGRLKTSDGNLLPFNTDGLANENFGPFPDDQLFLAGDIRANENLELTAMQTLFVREHNYWADQIHTAHPNLSDETIYQLARQIVGAELEVITYNEFLPALLGPDAMPAYTGYAPTVNPGISNEFSTAAFRFGHPMVDSQIDCLNNDGTSIPEGPVPLGEATFNPSLLDPSLPNHEGDIDPILKGDASANSQAISTQVVNALRNTLFGPPGSPGTDLAAVDIQRGRDHGLPDYNTTRVAYGLAPVTSFAEITSNVDLQNRLQAIYGNVDNIDLIVGCLAEDHLPGASVGPLTEAIIVNQFTRLRAGDRYWYQNNIFTPDQLAALENTTLADILRRNTSLTNLQDNVFFFQVTISGHVFNDPNGDAHWQADDEGLAGWTVELENAQGQVIATTTTDADGAYAFDNYNGLNLGTYFVQEVPPADWMQVTPDPGAIAITRGMTVDQVDFGNIQVPPAVSGVIPAGPLLYLAAQGTDTFPVNSGLSGTPATAFLSDSQGQGSPAQASAQVSLDSPIVEGGAAATANLAGDAFFAQSGSLDTATSLFA